MKPRRAVSFSVIVPTRNRVGQLDRCLASLAAVEYQPDRYEVIVVDDGGVESVAEVTDRYSALMRLTLIRTAHAGPASARNAGVAESSGDFLAFIDDDCTADPWWLARLAARLELHPGSAVGGRVVNALSDNRYARTSQGLQDFLYRWYHEENGGELRFFTTNNLAVSRHDFDRTGPFDHAFSFASEDREWCDRAIHAGLPLVYAPEAIVNHSHQLGFRTFLTQHYRYGQGAARFHAIRARRLSARVKLEPAAFYRGMFRAPFESPGPAPLMDSLLLIASQSASLLGFANDFVRNSRVRPAESAVRHGHGTRTPRGRQETSRHPAA